MSSESVSPAFGAHSFFMHKEEDPLEHTNTFLEKEPVSKLMRMYSVPCIISLLVAALYNIVDQIFIANASYLGSYGNAANTVVSRLPLWRWPSPL